MIDFEIKCLIIEGDCIMPVTATILWNLPLILIIIFSFSIGVFCYDLFLRRNYKKLEKKDTIQRKKEQ